MADLSKLDRIRRELTAEEKKLARALARNQEYNGHLKHDVQRLADELRREERLAIERFCSGSTPEPRAET